MHGERETEPIIDRPRQWLYFGLGISLAQRAAGCVMDRGWEMRLPVLSQRVNDVVNIPNAELGIVSYHLFYDFTRSSLYRANKTYAKRGYRHSQPRPIHLSRMKDHA